jgi:nicotinate phosphoribosyltransferase
MSSKPQSGLIPENRLGIATDLYQLTMANGYSALNKQDEIATFDLFVRKLPQNRSYLMVAGLEQALHYLTNVKFTEEDINFLKNKPTFKNAKEKFWDYLADFKFTGDVWAMPEGTIAFGNEPLMTVEAPIIEAQIAETYLLTCYNHQTKIASKAARCVEAAKGRPTIEFGMRRTDVGASVRGTRAAYIGGAVGTSNVMAEALFGIPSFGTFAHSWVQSHDSEMEAYAAYFQVYGEDTLVLIDTYDTVQGARLAAKLPGKIKGMRLDSGDIAPLSKDVREVLRGAAGKEDGNIFVTNDMNEYKIEDLLKNGAEIDILGIGTEEILSTDAPALGGIYKLAELYRNGVAMPKLKLSKNKCTYPGKKQVYRAHELISGKFDFDTLALKGEFDGSDNLEALLIPMIEKGKLVYEVPKLADVRAYGIKNREKLPAQYRKNVADQSYKVLISPDLDALTKETAAKYGGAR